MQHGFTRDGSLLRYGSLFTLKVCLQVLLWLIEKSAAHLPR